MKVYKVGDNGQTPEMIINYLKSLGGKYVGNGKNKKFPYIGMDLNWFGKDIHAYSKIQPNQTLAHLPVPKRQKEFLSHVYNGFSDFVSFYDDDEFHLTTNTHITKTKSWYVKPFFEDIKKIPDSFDEDYKWRVAIGEFSDETIQILNMMLQRQWTKVQHLLELRANKFFFFSSFWIKEFHK